MVPLRLRGAAVLLTSALGAALVVGWTFSQHALSTDNLPLAERVDAGHQLGVLLAALVVVLSIVGAAIGFRTARRAPSAATRHTTGALLLTLIALAIVGFAGVLATSQRGLFGSISHGVSSLADPHAKVPPNTPSRLTAIGSVRARYWNEALKIFKAHPALGAGAAGYETARLRYRTETLDVKHAHGYVVQTLSDLGLVGLALTLALLAAWLAAAGHATRPFQRRVSGWRWVRAPLPYTPERIGLLSMLCLVVVFGVHSFMDWTWYVPGDACVALLCAGWLAGRGPLAATAAAGPTVAGPTAAGPTDRQGAADRPALRAIGTERIVIATAVLIVTLLAAWAQWQPERSADASDKALSALAARDQNGALRAAQSAVDEDPLSAQALLTLSAVQQATGRVTLARTTLQRAVKLQPSNPQTWLALGEFDLASNPKGALGELRAAIYLDPESISPEAIANNDPAATALQNDYVRALRASMQASAASTPAATHSATSSSSSRPTGKQPSSKRTTGKRSTGQQPAPTKRATRTNASKSASVERARALAALRALPTR